MPCASQQTLRDPDSLFPNLNPGLAKVGRVARRDEREYARLVVRQLRSGKVGMRQQVKAGASVFTRGKASGRLREVWNGSKLSGASLRPPAPPHLPTPIAFLDLEACANNPIRVSKRDARCFFDQLALPRELHAYFGRPPVRVSDFLKWTDMDLVELRN